MSDPYKVLGVSPDATDDLSLIHIYFFSAPVYFSTYLWYIVPEPVSYTHLDVYKRQGNHVLYRVTPVFEGEELVARGVQMEAWSVEDNGDGICYNVYVYNNQPGVTIDYQTGESWVSGGQPVSSETVTSTGEYI